MTRWRPAASSLRDAFVAAAVIWMLLLVAAPYLASRAPTTTGSALLFLVYGVGSLICHQLPERSYHLWLAQMPVCARCAGIYCGALLGAVGARLIGASATDPQRDANAPTSSAQAPTGDLRSADRRSTRTAPWFEDSLRHARVLLGVAVVPTALTLLYEWSTGEMPAHAIRAAAGLPIGLAVAWLVVAAAENQVN